MLLPGALMAVAGLAFGGMAILPAAASPGTQVTAAAAMPPVEIAALAPADRTPPATANLELAGALAQGLAEANKPPPPPPPPPPERASRDRQAPEPEAGTRGRFARPGDGRLTSSYGRRWGRLHAGIDLAAGTGAPIRAAAGGTVTSSGNEGGYGRAIRILHSDGTVTVYGHMSKLIARGGQRVAAGELIGLEGNTGQSTGPHLHFEVRVNGSPINPVTWLRQRGISI